MSVAFDMRALERHLAQISSAGDARAVAAPAATWIRLWCSR
jgi:hypothetical protein